MFWLILVVSNLRTSSSHCPLTEPTWTPDGISIFTGQKTAIPDLFAANFEKFLSVKLVDCYPRRCEGRIVGRQLIFDAPFSSNTLCWTFEYSNYENGSEYRTVRSVFGFVKETRFERSHYSAKITDETELGTVVLQAKVSRPFEMVVACAGFFQRTVFFRLIARQKATI